MALTPQAAKRGSLGWPAALASPLQNVATKEGGFAMVPDWVSGPYEAQVSRHARPAPNLVLVPSNPRRRLAFRRVFCIDAPACAGLPARLPLVGQP